VTETLKPALNPEDHRRHAAKIYEAEQTLAWAESTSKKYPDANLADSYAIASEVTRLKLAAGREIRGHKIGLVSRAMRETVGATEPDFGAIYDDMILGDAATISLARRNMPMVEVETAFVLGRDLSGGRVTAADVIMATDFVLPALEFCDTRLREIGPKPVIDSVSDAAGCAAVVLGTTPRKLADFDLRREAGTLFINGLPVQSGVSSSIMGSPVNSVAWLANKLSEFAVELKAGQIIMPGSFLRIMPLKPGDTILAEFSTLGTVGFGAVA
jgi:2-keto-4-pentenoate hydratase